MRSPEQRFCSLGGLITAAVILSTPIAVNAETNPVIASTILKAADGADKGNANFKQGDDGVLVTVEATGLTPGWHAIHVHEKGDCSTPDFKSAGDHANPEKHSHGMLTDKGQHAGDMPNIWAHTDGTAKAQFFLEDVNLMKGDNALLDKDGAAVVVHAKEDDYASQPAGNAGDRVACGVIKTQ